MIRITSKKDGFRRCGVAHPKGATDHPDTRFTPDQLNILSNEPMLKVQHVENPEPDGPGGRPNAATTIALVQAAQTREELDKLTEGEERKGVLAAIAKRSAELVAVVPEKSDKPESSEPSEKTE